MIKKLALGALLIVVAAVTAAERKLPPPSVGISPNRIVVDVDKKTVTESATILNLTDKPVTLTASLVSFDLDEANEFRELPTQPGSLPAAMILNPVDFTIPPQSSQTVRLAIVPERLAHSGEHRAMLFVSELAETNQVGMQVRFRLGVPIYARVGEVVEDGIVHEVDVAVDEDRLSLDVDLSSEGNVQVRADGYYLWWSRADFPGEEDAIAAVERMRADPNASQPKSATGGLINTKPVFPGTRRTVDAKLIPPEDVGEYLLALQLTAGGEVVNRMIAFDKLDTDP